MTWLPIDGCYEVSDDGKVRRLADGRIISQSRGSFGYRVVRLSGPRRMCKVHRLVAAAFIPNPDGLPFVNHINCDPADNRVSNLEWCTQKQNLDHAVRLGRLVRNYWTGRRSPGARLTDEQAAQIRKEYAAGGVSLAGLAHKHSTSKRTVGRIILGQSYV